MITQADKDRVTLLQALNEGAATITRLTADLATAQQTAARLTLELEELNQDLAMQCHICRDHDKVKGSVATVCEAHYWKAVHETRELAAAIATMSDAAYRIHAENAHLRGTGAPILTGDEPLKESGDDFNETAPPGICDRCKGPHRFDTSVPSVLWNQVVRAKGWPEYLCATCVLEAFVTAGVGFAAELYGGVFHGETISVEVNGSDGQVAKKIQDENNELRWQLREMTARLDVQREANAALEKKP